MTATTHHFRVGNGDMTLVRLDSGRTILIDCNIRSAADDPEDETPDVASQLRGLLKRDAAGRMFVDAFLLTHPDQDHCRGLKNHFHLGRLSDWVQKDDKIVIREMWSSPIVFRRASKHHTLCDDALAWNTEARRRVAAFRSVGYAADGDRILVLGEDVNGKTNGLDPILVKVDTDFARVAGVADTTFSARLLGPLPASDEEEDEILSKNDSSVILNVSFKVAGLVSAKYLFGGDAEVGIWERVWDRNKDRKWVLEYDVLVAPHHCSWHSLSWDSWSDCGERAQVSQKARKALGQALSGATVISSSKPVMDDKNDPPCIRAKREYRSIVEPVKGSFHCVSDGKGDAPYELQISAGGVSPKKAAVAATVASPFVSGIGSQPLPHG